MALGAAVLIGGHSSRMGVDKAWLDWNGRCALDRVFDLATAAGAEPCVAVGREIPGYVSVLDPRLGPVGGILAAVGPLRSAGCDRVLVLAVDAPTMTLVDLAPLLAQARGAAYQGQPLPMVLPLAAVAQEAQADWPLARLVERAGLAQVSCPVEARARVRGANTAQERDALLAELVAREGASRGGAV